MEKTINININGSRFLIEEYAFYKLSNYIDEIKSYFTNSTAHREIIAEIENRIAVILQEKLNEQKQIITGEDISNVIFIIGEPEQIATAKGGDKKNRKFTHESIKYKKLYRDVDNKVIGGVCSGISDYFNIDPLSIRILFAVIFFIFGSGLLLYLILWLIIPKADTEEKKREMHACTC